jgi:hypothetical protein
MTEESSGTRTATQLPDEGGFSFGRRSLLHVVAVGGAIVAFALAPRVDASHPASSWSSFYSSGATLCAALLIAMALFSAPLGDVSSQRVRRWITPMTFVYLAIATAAFLFGSTSALGNPAYRYLFALGLGPGAEGLLTVVLMGWENIEAQRKAAGPARAAALDRDSSSGGVS